jgi:hypothetical protein
MESRLGTDWWNRLIDSSFVDRPRPALLFVINGLG